MGKKAKRNRVLATAKTTEAEGTLSRGTAKTETRNNGLADFAASITGANPFTQQIALPDTISDGINYMPISNNRTLCTYGPMTIGLMQTVIRQPVEDAMRGGFVVSCDELEGEEIDLLIRSMIEVQEDQKVTRIDEGKWLASVSAQASDIDAVKSAACWARQYGGSGLIINTDQDNKKELDIDAIGEGSPLEFISADRWELALQSVAAGAGSDVPFVYNGISLHRSRVIKVIGEEAPSFVRAQLQGWGMSELERCIRPVNSFLKFETKIFELMDEGKLDIYKIMGYNSSLMSSNGGESARKRVEIGNYLKSYVNGLVMDTEDDYIQKQISYAGLPEMYEQLRLNLSSALKIPMNKLFGESATGFGGGQDAIENYNAIVEGVRCRIVPLLKRVASLRCQQLFGFSPYLKIEMKPLRILDGEQEQRVLDSKQNRVMGLYDRDLVTGKEASEMLKKQDLLNEDTEVLTGSREPMPGLGAGDYLSPSGRPSLPAQQPARQQEGGEK